MVDRICVVLEGLSIAVCLHRLYGKKFRFDIATVSLMTIEMIMMQAIDYFGWPKELSMLFYLVVAGYCVIEFGFDIKKLIVNNVLYLIIIGILQIAVMMIFFLFRIQQVIVGIQLLLSNSIILAIVVYAFPKIKIKQLTDMLKDKEKALLASFVVCVIIAIFWLSNFKGINILDWIDLFQYLLFSICIILIGLLVLKMGKYKIKSKEIETELKIHKLYADSFDNLIDNIRTKQHEFDNHINTIYSQHYIYSTYDELVKAQQSYCKVVAIENRFNKLLNSGNPIIIGFLYGKFVEIDKFGIDISYHISIKELQIEIPIFKLVEILGNLIDNAVDALINKKNYNKVYIFMEERGKCFSIEVRNECDYVDYTELELFFKKGYSRKGGDRGLGLFHVKTICDEYKLNLLCRNKEVDGINWISFVVSNKKETI